MEITSTKTGIDFAKKETAFLTLSADQTTSLSAGNPVAFDVVEGDLVLSSNRVTLKANTKYKLSAKIRIGGNSSTLDYSWYNVTDSTRIGQYGRTFSSNNNSTDASFPMAEAVVTPTTDIEVEVRILVASNVSSIYYAYSSAYIEAVESYVPVRNPVTYIRTARNTTQSIPDSTYTTMIFDTDIVDELGEYNSTTGQFTAKYDGVYTFNWSILSEVISWSNGEFWESALNVNGSIKQYGFRNIISSTQNQRLSTIWSSTLKLSAGDTVNVDVWQNSGGSVGTYGSIRDTFLNVARIS